MIFVIKSLYDIPCWAHKEGNILESVNPGMVLISLI